MQSHCQSLTLKMLESLSDTLKASRSARQPLRPRVPQRRPPYTQPRRQSGPRLRAVTTSGGRGTASLAASGAFSVKESAGEESSPADAPGLVRTTRSMHSTGVGRLESGEPAIPPLRPDLAAFQEWHGALDTAYAVIKGMLGNLSSGDVHATHSSVLLLSFEATKMATQLRRALAGLQALQVRLWKWFDV